MLDKIKKYVKYKGMLKEQSRVNDESNIKSEKATPLYSDIEKNLVSLKELFFMSEDINFREFKIGNKKHTRAFVFNIDGLVDKSIINEHVIKALMLNPEIKELNDKTPEDNLIVYVKENLLGASEIREVKTIEEVLGEVLNGKSALYIDGFNIAIIIGAIDFRMRNVEEPSTEAQIRGPREGFVEAIRINTSLLRRKIKNSNLVFEEMKLGEKTNTKVVIAYIQGIADTNLVNEVKQRLRKIKIDSILETGYIEQFIDEHPLSPLPTVGNSERPDKVAGKLLEGRVGILCDGTPFVLTVPFLFIETLQVGEDYYSSPFAAAIMRFIRFFALMASILTAPLYIAMFTFQPELVPTILLVTAASSKEGTPFPTLIETIIMLTVFEVLRESGIRLPRQLGQALSIVGVLVIGEAAVRAGIVSSPMVIISAFTGITTFIVQPLFDSMLIFRGILIFLAGILGFYGIVLGLIIILGHVCSLKTFNSPYFAPIAPAIWPDLKDTFIRMPIWMMNLRPKSIRTKNRVRQEDKINQKQEDKRQNGGGGK